MTFITFVGIYFIILVAAAFYATHKSKSRFTPKIVFGKLLLLQTLLVVGAAGVLISGSRFHTVTLELKSAFDLAKLEVEKRVQL